ncbi:MAG TPA: hypothetical protein VMH40_02125 [Myxococcaceae bacterium]|nr:hypothetical protein [Myxococcaceae bacterium]
MRARRWGMLALALLGCAHEAAPPPPAATTAAPAARRPDSARYFPLAVGNHWTYEATYLGERSTQRVELIAFRDGSYVDKDGRALRVDGEGVRDQVRYLLHEPLTVGATWTSVVAPGSAEHYKVLSVRAPCESPAGRFQDCVEVESRTVADPAAPTRLLVNRMTFAAGVGIVRVRTALEDGQQSNPTAELRLTGFDVAALH